MPARRRSSAMQKDSIPFRQLVSLYEIFNKTVGKSPRTVSWYNQRLALFARFVGSECTLGDVTVERTRAFIVSLQDQRVRHANNPYMPVQDGPLSTAYVQGCVRALRAFASWLYEEGYTDTNRLKAVKPPRLQQKVIQVLTDDEVRRLLGRFNRTEAFGARNFAMAWTLLDCGLRASELCQLGLEDAHIEQGYPAGPGEGEQGTPRADWQWCAGGVASLA